MARPSILRADTLDLQDHDNPSAAEHNKHPQPNANAPHVQAQVQHVIEERHSEEVSLQEAWNIADNLAQDPSAIEKAQAANNTNGQDQVTNGAAQHGDDETEGADNEADADADADDDMMDRISSSPSIDDGGSPLRAFALPQQLRVQTKDWPARLSSLSPAASTPTPTRDSFNQIADNTPESSPFLNTPQHLPLRAKVGSWSHSPLILRCEDDPPPYDDLFEEEGEEYSRRFQLSRKLILPSKRHHQQPGRYDLEDDTVQTGSIQDRLSEEENKQTPKLSSGLSPVNERSSEDGHSNFPDHGASPVSSPVHYHFPLRSIALAPKEPLVESSSLSSVVSVDLDSVLLPLDDPLLEMPLASPTSSTGSWESMPDSLLENGSDGDSDDDDDNDDLFLNLDSHFIASGWDGECLHEAEDIDFEFVYALHTFVATVEGQANATKGDTMVLLDDSNSYWWLVRVVKDSSIGYLPAEHIETPTERLARLNKHRNIDLSATMLSDNSEKSRNPLKKAMRRRNAKTVQFAAPTYVEASDYDYSTEDEDNMIEPSYGNTAQAEEPAKEDSETEAEKAKRTEIEHPEAERRSSTGSNRASFDREQAATATQALAEAGVTGDGAKMAVQTEAAPLKSKRTRNTDSFLKDDKIDTVRITLTPGLLRDENAKSPSLDTARSSSFDELQKKNSPTEGPAKKDGKEKKKEEKSKKGGMLSGLFKSKKKDKKTKDDGSIDLSADRPSTELQRESPRASPVPSSNASLVDKNPLASPTGLQSGIRNEVPQAGSQADPRAAQNASQSFVAELEGSAVAHEMPSPIDETTFKRLDTESIHPQAERSSGLSNPLSPIANMLKPGDKEGKPKKVKKAKQRVELDDFDSPVDEGKDPFADQSSEDRLSESPVEISSHTFMHGTESIHIPTMGTDTSEDETEEDDDARESLTTSPSIIEHPAEPTEDDGELIEDNDPTPTARSPQPVEPVEKPISPGPQRGLSTDTTSSSSSSRLSPKSASTTSQSSWSDDSFKAWLEDGSEVRDMLVMINDKSGVKPVSADHPLMSDLFVKQRKGVQDMMGQLDGLLGSYLQRKGVQF